VGIIGTLEFAQEIKNLIADYLRVHLKLTMELEKTKITHLGTAQAKFLGMSLWIPRAKSVKIVKKYNSKAGRFIKSRINQTRVYFAAPIAEILKKLEKQGIIKRYSKNRNRLIPSAIPKLIFLDHPAIINRYNAIINGYLNYFSPVDNYFRFHQIVGYILRHSCAKTLARKFNLKTRAGAFKKFGKNLEVTITKKNQSRKYSLNIPESFKKIRVFKTKTVSVPDPLAVLNYKLESQMSLEEVCSVCGSDVKVEMHHVRHLRKDSVVTPGFTCLMSALNRKQLPVCRACHIQIHKGTYDGLSLNELWIKAHSG